MIIYSEDENKELVNDNPIKISIKNTIESYEKMLEACQNDQEKHILQNTIDTLKKQIKEFDKANPLQQKLFNQGGEIKKDDRKKKALSDIYMFYCKVQAMVGKSTTFERIEYEMNSLNLNKFSMICKDFGLYKKPEMINQVFHISKFYQIIIIEISRNF